MTIVRAITVAVAIPVATVAAVATAAPAAATSADLAVSVQPERERVTVERPVTYTITVTNSDPDSKASTTMRASLSPRLVDVSAPDGEIGEGYVTWSLTVPPQQSQTRELSGTYAPLAEAAGSDRVTLTACLLGDEEQPVLCATELTTIETRSAALWWWSGAVVVAAAGLALWWRWRGGLPAVSTLLPAVVRTSIIPARLRRSRKNES